MKASATSVVAALSLFATGLTSSQPAAAAPCAQPQTVQGFETCADVAQAKKEGAIVVYSPDPETGQAQLMASFHKTFPEIATNYIRLQTGALYAKIMSERQAHAYLDDVLFLTDMSFVLDFNKRHGYAHYVSPQMAAYKPEYKSDPEGDWTWGGIIVAGIAYNPTTVPADQAPKSWKDLLDPKWKDTINVKVSNSGLQHEAWYLIKQIYGDEYWQQFAKLNPRAFDSYVQQYDRCVNGQDKVISTAQYSGYLQFKAKGAPIAFVNPPEGLPADPTGVGIVQEAPHPAAARLFLDWFLSPVGQKAYIESSSLYSARTDVAPPTGGIPISEIKLLAPKDWDAFLKTHAQFVKEWDRMVGMR